MKISQFWDDAIVPALVDYIRIPAKSPHFDKAWSKNGYIDAAVELAAGWCRKNAVPGMKLEVVRLEGRTPVLLIEVPAFQTSSRQDRAHVRPPRQAARNGGLARGLRAVDAAHRRGQALRPRRGGRRLRGVLFARRCARCTRKSGRMRASWSSSNAARKAAATIFPLI